MRAAQAQLSASGQAVKQARNQREYAVLKSPFAGVVNSLSAKVGESVTGGQPIVVVSRGGELEVEVGVPEGMIGSVKVGTKATITVSALGDERYAGTVREVGFASESSTYPARVALDEPAATLRPGMAASALFELGAKKAEFTIPTSGVANSEAGSYAFVLEPGAGETFTVKRRLIKVGQIMGDSFEITDGLASGERVATAGLGNLVDGMTVRLLASSDEERNGATDSTKDAQAPAPKGQK